MNLKPWLTATACAVIAVSVQGAGEPTVEEMAARWADSTNANVEKNLNWAVPGGFATAQGRTLTTYTVYKERRAELPADLQAYQSEQFEHVSQPICKSATQIEYLRKGMVLVNVIQSIDGAELACFTVTAATCMALKRARPAAQ